MPLVTVRYDHRIGRDVLRPIGPALCELVAQALNTELGELTADDIDVYFVERSSLDVCNKDLIIEIEAMTFPDRAEAFALRIDLLAHHIRLDQAFEGLSFGIWAKLLNAAWVEGSSDFEQAKV